MTAVRPAKPYSRPPFRPTASPPVMTAAAANAAAIGAVDHGPTATDAAMPVAADATTRAAASPLLNVTKSRNAPSARPAKQWRLAKPQQRLPADRQKVQPL